MTTPYTHFFLRDAATPRYSAHQRLAARHRTPHSFDVPL